MTFVSAKCTHVKPLPLEISHTALNTGIKPSAFSTRTQCHQVLPSLNEVIVPLHQRLSIDDVVLHTATIVSGGFVHGDKVLILKEEFACLTASGAKREEMQANERSVESMVVCPPLRRDWG
jgi:hypothetical protein